MSFAADFSQLVAPALARISETQALLVTLGIVTFSEAERAVLAHALNRGAAHLGDDDLCSLIEQVAISIIEGIDRFEPLVADFADRSRRLTRAIQRKGVTNPGEWSYRA